MIGPKGEEAIKLAQVATSRVMQPDLEGTPHTHVVVFYERIDVAATTFYAIAPVGPDGAFSLSGVPLAAIRVGVALRGRGSERERFEFRSVPASPGPVAGLELTIASSTRTIDVVVRSEVATAIDGADVFLIPGKQQLANVGEIFRRATGIQAYLAKPIAGDSPAGPVAAVIRPGDILAHVEHAGQGELTVCACSYPGDLLDPAVQRGMNTHQSQMAVRCKQIGADASVVVLEVPPPQRFD